MYTEDMVNFLRPYYDKTRVALAEKIAPPEKVVIAPPIGDFALDDTVEMELPIDFFEDGEIFGD